MTLVEAVVAVTTPFGYPDPGSIILIELIMPDDCFILASALAPVLIEAAAVPDVADTTAQIGKLEGLPNAIPLQLEVAGSACDDQLIPSGLVAHTPALVAIATNMPWPYLILDHDWLVGNPTP